MSDRQEERERSSNVYSEQRQYTIHHRGAQTDNKKMVMRVCAAKAAPDRIYE
jgi:hypothetical protein